MTTLNRIQHSATDFLAAALIAALVVVVPSTLHAQQSVAAQKATAAKAAPTSEEENEAPTAKKPGDEGIKVHGHWIIDVKDKDGKLVEHRDFYNSLVPGVGPAVLLTAITGSRVTNSFTVNVIDAPNNKYYVLFPATTSTVIPLGSHTCAIGLPVCNPNLTTTLHTDTTGYYDSVKLAGQFTPTAAASITYVQTLLNACTTQDGTPIQLTPVQCAVYHDYGASSNITMGDFNFTSTTLSTPLAVAAGQTVSVSVVLSFS